MKMAKTNKKSDKNFDTSLRILEVLRILLNYDITKSDLIEKMNENSQFENVYTFEAFIKYFNTLSVLGFKIKKDKNIYKLRNTFYRLQLTKDELAAVFQLISHIKKLHNKTLEQTITNILNKSLKYMDEDTQNQVENAIKESAQNIKSNNLAETLESLLYDNRFISIKYIKNKNTQDTITARLKEIIEKKDEIILVCHDKKSARNKKINAASIISITQTPNMADQNNFNNDSVVFRIYGRLAQVYKLKQGEKVLDFSAGYKTILNKGEDKDIIIKRLLKYGENCKIVQPKIIQDEFLMMTNEILKNLEEDSV